MEHTNMTNKSVKSFISGCAGPELTTAERTFFAETQPWGLILFQRNCVSPEQLRKLATDFRAIVKRKDAPVLIDQEGGRVQRMKPEANPVWPNYPSAAQYGKLYARDPMHALRTARNIGRLMANDLVEAGISVNCLPVLDVPQEGSHAVISDRAYGTDPAIILALSRSHVAGFMDGGILPVMKHIPGHGRAKVDSHKELPVVNADRATLEAFDFHCFAGFADCPMAMTAHVVYQAIDPLRPATLSARVLRDVVRKQIGFAGLLMSDDLSMQALGGSFGDRAHAALDAGCDVVLHCNGVMAEMVEVAKAAIPLKGKAMARAKAALRQKRKAIPFDERTAKRDLEYIMGL
jgi:beta-N-acetylhexosaminidase